MLDNTDQAAEQTTGDTLLDSAAPILGDGEYFLTDGISTSLFQSKLRLILS